MKARLLLLSIPLLSPMYLAPAQAVERPDQYVLMAFDNCTELERWDEWTRFLKKNPRIRFTFFVSGVNFLTEAKSVLYQGPHHQPGQANIDFGGSVQDVTRRV